MKIAVVGSRKIHIDDIGKYLPTCDEIVTGGAEGVDRLAMEYAEKEKIRLTVFLPEYTKYKRGAPIVRNRQIVDYSDKVIAFWDGSSKGTLSVIEYAKRTGKSIEVIMI